MQRIKRRTFSTPIIRKKDSRLIITYQLKSFKCLPYPRKKRIRARVLIKNKEKQTELPPSCQLINKSSRPKQSNPIRQRIKKKRKYKQRMWNNTKFKKYKNQASLFSKLSLKRVSMCQKEV